MKSINMRVSPLVSGLVSPAGAHCTVPPADHDASPGSPRAADRQTGRHSDEVFCDCGEMLLQLDGGSIKQKHQKNKNRL